MDNTLLLGAYGFYDVKRTDNANRFSQGTIGIEALTINWDFRGNYYFSENEIKSTNSVMENSGAYVEGSNIFVNSQSFETSFDGFDVEIGRKIPHFENLKLLGSYYHFWNNVIGEKVDGYRGRGEYNFFNRNGHTLSLEGEYSHDNLRSGTTFGGLRYSYRFGVSKNSKENNSQYTLSEIEKRMTDRVVRDIDIVTKEVSDLTKKLEAGNGQEQMIIFVDNSATTIGDGTKESPYQTLQQAQNNSAKYDVIYVKYGDGTIAGYNQGIILKDHQKLFGQGQDLTLGDVMGNNAHDNVVIAKGSDAQYSKITKSFSGGDNSLAHYLEAILNKRIGTVTVANNNVIKGLDISSTNDDGSFINDYGSGISIFNKTGSIISNNKLSNNFVNGVQITSNGNNDISNNISNNIVSGNGWEGVVSRSYNSSSLTNIISDNNISGNDWGIYSASYDSSAQNNIIANNNIANNDFDGIYALSRNSSNLSNIISKNTISSNGNSGIALWSSESSVQSSEIYDNIIVSNTDDGIHLESLVTSTQNIKAQNNNISSNVGRALFITKNNSAAANIDFGAGALSSAGGNNISGNVDLDGLIVVAQDNYWGQNTGINPADLNLANGAILDSDNYLTKNPF
ncbi:MAG: hypothetical protein ACJAZX_001326 [Rickettsiales bacterium]|jgi:hypothetical protein